MTLKSRSVVGFDLHGVLTTTSLHTREEIIELFGVSKEEWDVVERSVFKTQRLWDKLETNQITAEYYHQEINKALKPYGVSCTLETALSIWSAPDPFSNCEIVRPMHDLVSVVREQVTTCLVTNNIANWRGIWSELVQPNSLFDFIFDSSEVELRKPNKEYWALVEQETKGTSFLLVDDLETNFLGARAAGWDSILHVDIEKTCLEVEMWVSDQPLNTL